MDKTKSIATSKSDGAVKAELASASLRGVVARRRGNFKMIQNVMLIWLDSSIDKNNDDYFNTITQLQHVVNNVNTFTDGDQCIEFIDTINSNNEKVSMIISGSLGQHIVPRIHDMSQVDSIFIFCGNKQPYEQWAKDWGKIKGVFTEIGPICEALKKAAQQCEHNAMPISFMATSGDVNKKNLDQLDCSFMYTQILKEILLSIKFDPGHIKEFIEHCCIAFANNKKQLIMIKEFEQTYNDNTPIWWYTCQCFLYPMLNCALRAMDVDVIIQMGFFIGDLHRHIEQLHLEQFGGGHSGNSFTLYRGQGLSTEDFELMEKTKGGLMAFNNFLSTSQDRDISHLFAESNLTNPDLVGVLFVITVDPYQSTTPFASLNDISYFPKEDEVLFSMHTVFRINDIKPLGEKNRLYQVDLTLTSDNDKDLRVLTERIRVEIEGSTGWDRLGVLLIKMGQPEKAQEVYELLLEQTTKEVQIGYIYYQLGWAKYLQGEYQEALKLYEKALKIRQQSLPLNHLDLAKTYNNIGGVYYCMGDYPKALSFYEKALAIRQKSLPPNHPDLAKTYNNIGGVYNSVGDYPKALSIYEKALKSQQQSLSSNHPDLAMFYNIGMVYNSMGDYSKALQSLEKTLAIRQQSLPPNHPHSAMSYANIGNVYNSMGDYSKALQSHEKTLAIRQQSLPPNHPHLAGCYDNIGSVYYSMGDYPKALQSHEKALAIQQQSLPPNHPHSAKTYNNIGGVYNSVGDYPKALSIYEKALKSQQQSLSSNHPDLAMFYNIGMVYNSMGDYSKALQSLEKTLAIRQQSLPPNHPHSAMSYGNIGHVYYSVGDYLTARSFFERAVNIAQQTLPPNHPAPQKYRRILDIIKNK